MARKMIAFIKRRKARLNVFPFSLSLEKEGPDGQTLAYDANEDTLLLCERSLEAYAGGRPLRLKNAISCYISTMMSDKAAFAVVARTRAKTMKDNAHAIRFERHPMNKMLCRLYEERTFIVKESLGLAGYMRDVKTILSLVKNVVTSKLIPVRPRSNITDIRPSVWIEYDQESSIDFAFWKNNINNTFFNIVHYLDRGDTPVRDEITGEIEKSGALWVDAHLGSIASNISIPMLTALAKDLFKRDTRPFWLKIFDFEYAFWRSAYAAYFKKFKVKILIQYQEWSWKQEAQAAAVESAGGIMMGFHWSSYLCRMKPSHLFPFHVFFEWGRIFEKFLPVEDGICDYWLPSGLWIDKDEDDLSGI
ncbi:MAG: hypothetical protein WC317_05835, partial [Candidatus Omnitrophota bacterium]